MITFVMVLHIYTGYSNSNLRTIFSEIRTKRIVEHCDDLQYLFTSKQFPIILDRTSAEGEIITKYTKLLYNFAKNG